MEEQNSHFFSMKIEPDDFKLRTLFLYSVSLIIPDIWWVIKNTLMGEHGLGLRSAVPWRGMGGGSVGFDVSCWDNVGGTWGFGRS